MRSYLVLLLALSAPALTAQTRPSFEVATIRPTAGPIPGVPPAFGNQKTTDDTLIVRHTQLVEIIRRGFSVVDQELVGPDWIHDQRFDITAKSAAKATDAELWAMVQPLLEDRLQLKYHREPREVSGLALTVGKNAPKLTKSEGGSNNIVGGGGTFRGNNVTMVRLAQLLSSLLKRPVTDATGLEGTYNFVIDPRSVASPGQGPIDIPGMVMLAVQEQLGLKLESRKFVMQVMVIDHIEQPGEN